MKCPDCNADMDLVSYFNNESKVYAIQLICRGCNTFYSGLLERMVVDGKKEEQVLCDSDLSMSCSL